ncbi:hypothetical protein [Lelliottia wanjuensis]|uniref:hypothetical protein n=1 Tax=Lelliottia wanjuensis TaxID=3050585 RepID=UPI00254A5E9E|nr:hypothetical protein [Lelliottia sp. V104_15]MDK9606492.1 hypothetical protein [Lelliottia sp. V104_15]
MNKKIELLIGVTVTAKDWTFCKDKLLQSLINLHSVFGDECIVYVVLQDENIKDDFFPESDIDWIIIRKIKYMGVSNARNLCIEKSIECGAKHILFHDATIYWSYTAAQFMFDQKTKIETPKVHLCFSDSHDSRKVTDLLTDVEVRQINPIYNTYVGSYLLRVSNIKNNRFNNNYGPGSKTQYKSGEDVLFLFDYFKDNNLVVIPRSNNVVIYHPPRPSDYSKHLLYAYGQGALFRELLKNHKSGKLLLDCLLFFGNAFARCFFFKKNAFSILLNRLKGFIGV